MTFDEIDEAIKAMGSEADLAPLLAPGVPALVFAPDPLRVLWSSRETNALANAIVTAPDGRIDPAFPAARRVEALARSEAPMIGKRFEKIRFETSTLAPLTTCACRRITMPDGTIALALSFIDRIPQIRRPAGTTPAIEAVQTGAGHTDGQAPGQAAPESGETAPGPDAQTAPDPAPEAVTGPVRFLWECDTSGSITRISGDLAAAVGVENAALVGRRLSTVLDPADPDALAFDPKEIVLDLIARRETFSGRRLFWKARDGAAIAVDFAGFPAPGAAGRQGAYRGFGIARPEISCDWASLMPHDSVPAQPDPASTAPDTQTLGDHAVNPTYEPVAQSPLAALLPESGDGSAGSETVGERDDDTAAATGARDPEPSAKVREETGPDVAEMPQAPMHAPAIAAFAVTASLGFGAQLGSGAATPLETPLETPFAGFATQISGFLGDAATPLRCVSDADEAPLSPQVEPVAAYSAAAQTDPVAAPAIDAVAREEAAAALEPDEELTVQPDLAHSQSDQSEASLSDPSVAELSDAETPSSSSPAPNPLSVEERNAFREIAKALGARFAGDEAEGFSGAESPEEPDDEASDDGDAAMPQESAGRGSESAGRGSANTGGSSPVIITAANDRAPDIRAVLDRMPAGVVVHRGEQALYVNRYLLDLLGYVDLAAFMEAGGLARLFQARPAALTEAAQEATAPLIIANRNGESVAVEVRLTMVDWLGYPASMLMLRKIAETDPVERLRAVEADLASREARLREQAAILDTATDGVIVLDQGGRILSLNRAAEALFGYDQREIAGESLTQLLETESHVSALEYLAAMREDSMRSVLNDGCEVLGHVRQGGAIPLFMTLGVVGEGLDRKFCAVLRDMTAFKQTENELIAARRTAEAASAQKSEFLARISHEVRTPLNAIIGFAEVMLDERFGPIGNERYRDYLTDIHASGEHVISLVNDLLDLAKIEAGRMDLNFTRVALNDLVSAGVAMMQPEAARERIVLRTSFADRLPPVLADERAMRQIVINLLSNAVKFTDAGGQVIVSTARGSEGDVIFRVRDTGIGMNDGEVEAALEPFRQLATSRKAGGTGLGLPLTKALVEANQGSLRITSRKNEGTLAEVVFPPARVVAD